MPLWQSSTLPPFPDLYFPVGQSTANPKSLPASPWRRASVEQMASVCRAAIKEGAWTGKRKWVRMRGEQGRQREAASASGLSTDMRICVRSNAPSRPFTLQCTPSRVFPAKTNTTHPMLVMENHKYEPGNDSQGAGNEPPNLTMNLSQRWEVRQTRITWANPTTKSTGLTLPIPHNHTQNQSPVVPLRQNSEP